MSKQSPSSPERRSFLTGLNAGAASLAALAVGGVALAQDTAAPASEWEPALHEKDDWMEALPGKHRLLFDTTSEEGFRNANLYTTNYIAVNRDEYGLESSDLAIIIVARHMSTPFAYNDAMWAKYGAKLLRRPGGAEAEAAEAPTANRYARQLGMLAQQGVQFAVCSMATLGIASMVAGATGGDADEINEELKSNLVPNARMVPAGIVAVNRAQERKYSLVTT